MSGKGILKQFIFTLLFIGLPILASAEPSIKVEVIALKSQIEDSIAKRYRERISTQLPVELFSVTVQVDVSISDIENRQVPSSKSEGLSDLSLGIVESVSTSAWIPSEIKNSIQVKKVEVGVGLSEKLGNEYAEKFKPWLTNAVKSDFGKYGVTKFSKIAPLPKEVVKPQEPEPPRQLTSEEKFGYYQNALGLGLVSLVLLVGILLLKFLPSKDMKEQINLAVKIQEMKNSQMQLTQPTAKQMTERKYEKEDLQLSANLVFDNLKEHQRKVALIAFSNNALLDDVFNRWFDEGDEGRKKVASLIDSLLIQVGPKNADGSFAALTINWTLPERIKKDKKLSETFRDFPSMSLQEKTTFAEKTYWDLLSVKTFGDQITKTLFSSVAHLPSSKIVKLLNGQDKKAQSIAVLHLPVEKMEQVVAEMSFEDKKSIVMQAFDTPKLNPQDLELADESLRLMVKQQEKLEDGSVEIQSMVPQMLMCLNPLEEIQLIQQITPRLPDRGAYLKSNFPSLAFLSEWPAEKLNGLLSSSRPQDILCLLKTVPEMTEAIFAVLPSRTQLILKDSMARELTKDETIRGLETLKLKMYKMTNDGQLVLAQVFPPKPQLAPKAA